MTGFSKKGLIEQLSSSAGEGFAKADAVFAANHVDVNWNDEAVESAQSYLDMTSFSKDGLIEQLSSWPAKGSPWLRRSTRRTRSTRSKPAAFARQVAHWTVGLMRPSERQQPVPGAAAETGSPVQR
jgi:hypothetical protein